MEYKKIKQSGYNLHIIKTDRFKTVQIRANFKRPINKDEITKRNFLNDLLINSTKNYPTIRDLEIETENLYNFGVSSNCYKSGNYSVMSLSCVFLNEKYTEKGMLNDSIKFFFEFIFNPNIENNKFDKSSFEYTKECLKTYIESIKDNPGPYSIQRLRDEMDKDNPMSYHSSGYIDDLDKITYENLYEYYLDVLKNDVVDIFVIGNVLEDEIIKIFNKYVLFDRKQPKYKISHMITKCNDRKDINEIKDESSFNQSKLCVGLNVSDMDDYERKYTLNALSFILGGSGDSKLFKKLREENSLCYYASCSPYPLAGDMLITSGIEGSNYEKAVSLIKECIEDIQNGGISKEDVEQEISVFINGCLEIYDSPASIINTYLAHEYLGNDLIDEKIEKAKEMTAEKIIALSKKIKIDTIYLLEGGDNNE